MSLDEVRAGLQAVLESMRQQRNTCAALTATAKATLDRLRVLTRGAQHPLVARMLAACQATITHLHQADSQLAASATALVAYGQEIGISLDAGNPAVGHGAAEHSPAVEPPAMSRPVTPGFVSEVARRLRVPPGAKVAGIATTADGTPLHDEPIVNGSRGALTDNAATLKPNAAGVPWSNLDVALSHVEGHVAALMRTGRAPSRVTLVATEEPCTTRWGCHRLLPGLLPAASELAVYVADQHGNVRYHHTYRGTGTGVT